MDTGKVKLVRRGQIDLNELLKVIKSSPNIEECGAIVIFLGIVRGVGYDKTRVKTLHYEAMEDRALQILGKIRDDILSESEGVKELLIWHVIDDLSQGEETIAIMAAASHRDEAFSAARRALERVKVEPPIWKKEITEKGEYWVSEEGTGCPTC